LWGEGLVVGHFEISSPRFFIGAALMDTDVTGANFRDADLASARIGGLVGEGASNLDAALNLDSAFRQ
jgi:uncharacterized protein YjbI with pentapeptide repeats